MKKLFRGYEEVSGSKSLIRFMKFGERNFSKSNFKKICRLFEEFEKEINSNNMRVRKDYLNFREFVFNKIK